MAIIPYLAMTAAELAGISSLPPKIAWMACHFSPYSTGISNLPNALPENAILILNDITPIHGHDPERIGKQLIECAEKHKCSGILLDFQRPGAEETAVLAKHLVGTLPCPVAVSECYAAGLDCPVFLSLVPCHVPPQEHLERWKGRDIWLEIGLEGERLRLTEDGCRISPLPQGDIPDAGYSEASLHCHYHIELSDTEARFTLWRTREDMEALVQEAENIGIQQSIGLFQEFHSCISL